jgi:hypothetical protein
MGIPSRDSLLSVFSFSILVVASQVHLRGHGSGRGGQFLLEHFQTSVFHEFSH